MTLKITADEIFVEEGGARVRTRCGREYIDDAMVAWAATYARLDVGDQLRVQTMTHEKDAVLWQRRYIVASRRDFLKRTDTNGNINHRDDFEVTVLPESPWWEVTPAPKVQTAQSLALEVRWNLGIKAHEVLNPSGERVASFTQEQGGKEAAEAFAAGKTLQAA